MADGLSPFAALNKPQANELFEIVRSSGLEPQRFRLRVWSDRGVDILEYRERADFSVLIARMPTGEWEWQSKLNELILQESKGKWAQLVEGVTVWVMKVKEWQANVDYHVAVPDLWGEMEADLSAEGEVSALSQETPNDEFSDQERLAVSATIEQLRALLTEHVDAASEAWERIDSRLHYLEAASQRIGKKDWLLVLTGTLANIAIDASLAPEIVRALFRVASQGLQVLFGGGQPELPAAW